MVFADEAANPTAQGEKKTPEQLADEDAIAEEADYLAEHVDDEMVGSSGDEGEAAGAVDGGAGDGQGEGGQAEAAAEGQASDPVDSATILRREGWIYWVGYLANKFRYRHKDLNLGLPTSQYRERFGEDAVPPYLNSISMGGLTVPSTSFLELIESFEKAFHAVHGDELSYEPHAITKVRERIHLEFPRAPADIVRTYARGRVFLRIKYLNFLRHEAEAAERAEKKRRKEAEAAKCRAEDEAGLGPRGGGQAGPSNTGARARGAPASAARRNARKNTEWAGRRK